MFSNQLFHLQHFSYRLESGGSNPTSSDSYSDRASARARREAREARLASLTSRVEEDSNRDYKKVGSLSRFLSWLVIQTLLAFPTRENSEQTLSKEHKGT